MVLERSRKLIKKCCGYQLSFPFIPIISYLKDYSSRPGHFSEAQLSALLEACAQKIKPECNCISGHLVLVSCKVVEETYFFLACKCVSKL
jgi:hypothetical protein